MRRTLFTDIFCTTRGGYCLDNTLTNIGQLREEASAVPACSKRFPAADSRMEIDCCSLPRTINRFSATQASRILRGTCFIIQFFASSVLAFRKLSACSHVPSNSTYSLIAARFLKRCFGTLYADVTRLMTSSVPSFPIRGIDTVTSHAYSRPFLQLCVGWLRGTVVERRSLAGELSLSCARPAVDE